MFTKVKLLFSALFGGVSGIIKELLDLFNDKVLSKIKDKDEAAAYCEDCEQLAVFLEGIITRHEKWMSEGKRTAIKSTIDCIRKLAAALKDCNIDTDELDAIVDQVKAAIDAWKAAK